MPSPSQQPDPPCDSSSTGDEPSSAASSLASVDSPQPLPQLSAQALVGLLWTAIFLIAGWFHSFQYYWSSRWFPSWRATDLTLWQRMTNGESYYTHGPLVPLICLGVAFYTYRRVGAPAQRSLGATLTGWVLLVATSAVHLLASFGGINFVSGFCLILMMIALLLLWGGWRLLRAYWVPVVFLAFMVPPPMNTIADLNFQLKFVASRMAVWSTNHLFGIPALLDGAFVHLPPYDDGTPKRLVVENVCGGLRSLIALTFFASLFAVVCRVKGPWRIFMLLMAVPVAVLCNVVRITGLNVVAHYWGIEAAREGAWFHDLSGLFVFIVALVVLFALEGAVMLLSRLFRRDWVDERLLPYLSRIARTDSHNFKPTQPPVLVCLLLLAAASVYVAAIPMKQNITADAYDAVPQSLVIGGEMFIGQDLTLDPAILIMLETDDYVYRKYAAPSLPDGFDVLIVFSTNIRNGAHAPEVCLEAAGQHIVSAKTREYPLPQMGSLDMRELITQRDNHRTRHTYVFKAGDHYTTSYFNQQAAIFVNGIFSRNTAGAMIRFTVQMEGRDEKQVQDILDAAIEAIMPHIEEGLP